MFKETKTAQTERLVTLQKFLSRLILLCMLPFLFLATYLVYSHMSTIRNQLSTTADNLVHNVVTSLDNRLESQIVALQMIAASPVIDNRERWKEFQTVALSFREGFGGHIILAGTDMQMLFNSRSPLGASLPKLPVPKGHAAAPEVLATGKPSVGDSFMGPIASEQLVTVIVPVLREEKVKYLLLATIETRQFDEMLKRFSLPDNWSMTIKDSIGGLMASRTTSVSDPAEEAQASDLKFVAASKISHWSVTLNVPLRTVLKSLSLEGSLLVIGIIIAALASFLGGRYLGGRLSRSVANISGKNPMEKSGAKIVELEAVHTELNEIAAAKDSTQDALRERELMYEALVEQASDSFFVHDWDGKILEVNQEACKSFGYTKDELLNLSISDIERDFDLEKSRALWESMVPGVPLTIYGQQKRKDGSTFHVEVRFSCAEWKDKRVYLGLVRDITERAKINEELEKRVEERTAQLVEANKELEAFSYSVSHDLRAPLRAINGYSTILAEDYSSMLDAEGKRICSAIEKNANSMSRLIEDLLTFSRISRQSVGNSRVDTEAMVHSVLGELAGDHHKARLTVDIGKLEVCFGDEAMLRQVWTNLISNAIKFSSKVVSPHIEIGCERKGDFLVYSISDNGAGFDMKYKNQLFGVFQRLHSVTDFEGTGVGLAIVERIIHKHGGTIDAEGEVGKGAKFWFSLPSA